MTVSINQLIIIMKRVFIIHGFEGSPNGGWRPWLMGELAKRDVYACALAMPNPDKPVRAEWVAEIARHVDRSGSDELYLVGHSLGVPAIMRYLETAVPGKVLAGAVLVSGPCEAGKNTKTKGFTADPFDFALIKSRIGRCTVIHGDNDPVVPLAQARKLSQALGVELAVIKNGGHLNGSGGWHTLPECFDALLEMMGERDILMAA